MAKINIEQAKRRITFASDELVREVFAEEVKRVVNNTPVVTGTTRANWVVGIGRKSRAKPKLRKKDPNGQATIQAAIAKVRKSKVKKKTFFTNAVPWIRVLEWGLRGRPVRAMVRRVRAAHPQIANMVAARVLQRARRIR